MLEREKTEKELIPLFLQKKLGATITLPLAGGVLTGKYNNTIPKDSRYSRFSNSLEPYLVAEKWEPVINKIKNLTIIAESLGMSMAQLAIAWCLKNQNISSIIVGTSNEDQLKENISSIGFVNNLTLEIMDDIEKILDNKPKVIDYCLDYDRAKELS
jgi:aryl-alcohol dehydrogenase-like predicted oxidoreductase